MKRFLISFFVILIIPKLLIADGCLNYLKFDWKFLGSGKASYNLSNTSKVNDIKISMISLKNKQSKVIQVHSPMIIVKRNESRKLEFNLTQPYYKYKYQLLKCETVAFKSDNKKSKEEPLYWSNTKSGPDSFEKAINLLKNIDKRSIEGIWRYPEGFSTLIIKEKDLFREYVIAARASIYEQFIGTLEATYIKTGYNKYKFYQRVFYPGGPHVEHTMAGTVELKSGYSLHKDYFEVSKTGLNMDTLMTKVYPGKSVPVDVIKKEYTHEEAKEKYTNIKYQKKKNKEDNTYLLIILIVFGVLIIIFYKASQASKQTSKTKTQSPLNPKKEINKINNSKKIEIKKETKEKKKKKIKIAAEKPFIDLIQSLKYKDKLSQEEFNKKSQSEKKKLYDLYYKIYSFFMDRFRSEAKVETYFKSQNGKTALLGWQVVSKGVFEYSIVETISYFLNLDESITPEIALICIKKYSEKLNEEKDIESKVKGIQGVKSGDLGTSKEKCIFIRYKVETEMKKFIFEKKMNINWKILKEFLDNRSKSPMS